MEANSIIQAGDGNFYGTAGYGGPWPHATNDTSYGSGTVFKMTPSGILSLLHAFNEADGYYPVSLIQASDGNFYGTAVSGGTNGGGGTLFQISASGEFKMLYSFNYSGPIGRNPLCSLVQASDGAFYGTTAYTGVNTSFGGGGVFRLSVPSADSPSIQSVNAASGSLTLKWLALKRRSYQVQFNSDFTSPNWSNLAGPILATQNIATASDPIIPGEQRYYRVALLP
jgi:uncharacterized repeat protein (TIGR03803 family)